MDGRRLYQQIADEVRALIQSGQFMPGSRLPAERDLAQQLGVSRPSLREAMIALEIDGSVEVRMGSGVYVCPPAARQTRPMRALGESPSDLMQARAAIEGAVVVLACARVEPGLLVALRASLDAMGAAIAGGRRPLASDRAFHLAVAGHAGNAVLTAIVGRLFDERHSPITRQLSARFETPATWTAALSEHETIFAALEAGDPLRAQAAMAMHLRASQERWVGS